MKIIIITTGRTGSTNLLNSLINQTNFLGLDEPFIKNDLKNKNKKIELINKNKNIIVKHIISHNINIDNIFLEKFDSKVILLRKNIKKHVESIIFSKYQDYLYDNNKILKKRHHLKYNFSEVPSDFVQKFEKELTEWTIKNNEVLLNLSQIYNIPIIYYEDIYSENIENNYRNLKKVFPFITLDIKKYFNPKKKYRINLKKQVFNLI